MRKNILLLTTIYPAPDLEYGTPAIHYFTKEWVKMDYNVKVIHFQAVYPSIFYIAAKFFRDIIASRTGNIVFTKKEKEDKRYSLDGVLVDRYPIFKYIPQGRFTAKVLNGQIQKIINTNKIDNFYPEIIIGHFSNPQLTIVNELKKVYDARTCLVMHDHGHSIKKIYAENYQDLMKNIDIWGYRSMPIKNGFEKNFGVQKHFFMCYSGIPEKYIIKESSRRFPGKITRFSYVGELIARKHPSSLVEAIKEVYPDNDFKIIYIGKGAEETRIRSLVSKYKIEQCVIFKGHVPRDEVQSLLDESECMIMISSNETFGLVYLEAMARGCIIVGSCGEGMDGIIEHGINGYLCQPGNAKELSEIIKLINNLSSKEREIISANAIATARRLTDYKAALEYITKVNY